MADSGKYGWFDAFGSAITVCDAEGTIVYMNEKSKEVFAPDGGGKLIGRSLAQCHKPESWQLIQELMRTGRSNTYTIEKKGLRKLIHQAPWFEGGRCAGLVEISIELPGDMPHHVRE